MPNPYAAEFTSELGPQYEASLLNQISQGETAALGKVRQKRSDGGLDAQASAGAEEGAIEAGALTANSNAIGQFNMDVANKKYSERMTDEAHQFQDFERQKDEEFRKSMAEMGYEFQRGERNAQNRADKIAGEQGLVEGSLATIGVNALNPANWLGGKKP